MGVCTGAGRVTICHKNIPGMLGAFTTVMGNAGVNISDMTNKGKGDYALHNDWIWKAKQQKRS